MNKMTIVFATALAFAACGGNKKDVGSGPGGGGGPDCDKAIANAMALSKATMTKMGVDDPTLAKMRDLGVRHCREDKWSDDAVRCMTDAKAEAEAQGCYGNLTPDQQTKMNNDAQKLTPPPAAGSGSAP